MKTFMFARHAIAKSFLFSSFRADYLCALEYFLRKFAADDPAAHESFKVYVDKLLSNGINGMPYSYFGDAKALDIIRSFLGAKSDFLTFYYRFFCAALLIDCLSLLAFSDLDLDKARAILSDFYSLSPKRYHQFFKSLFDYLYAEDHSKPVTFKGIWIAKNQIECWNAEKIFEQKPLKKILFTASMSAGKSMLINAIAGKKITRTKSTAATGRIHYIYNKPFEDGLTAKLEDNGSLTMDASEKELMDENNNDSVQVWTYFRSFLSNKFRWCLIDTPGVNFSRNPEHAEITHKAIEKEPWDYLIYIVNGEYIGTIDDRQHIEYIADHAPGNKVIFLLNKLDNYSLKDDSIPDAVSDLHDELEEIGFKHPVICPISAYTAMLAKKYLLKSDFNPDEKYDFDLLRRKFMKADYDLSVYSKFLTDEDRAQRFDMPKNFLKKENPIIKDCYNLLINSGLSGFEKILSEG
ncbi:MAG: dynamin family protein [Synergistaceae bacterium]|nr:dynamin family protein [Synergistaceae bacterium]